MNNAYERLKPYLERAMAFQSAKILFEWDNETLAPREAEKNTTRVVGILSGEYFNVVTDPQVKELVRQCKEETDSLTQVENAVVQELAEEMDSLIGSIADYAKEQAVTAEEISHGIDQIAIVVQTNVSTAESSAAASEELSGQAAALKEQVSRFRLKK